MKDKTITQINRLTDGIKRKINISNQEANGLYCVPMLSVGDSTGGPVLPGFVSKDWGSEHIYQNNDKYCMKLLTIEDGKSCSMHFHLEKHETMLVIEGTLIVDYVYNKEHRTQIVNQWEAFTICPGLPHSLRSQKGTGTVRLIEASTPDYETDSIRIANGR